MRNGGTAHDLIAITRDFLLRYAREEDADFAIFLDSDILPMARDLIGRLTGHNLDIVCGPYVKDVWGQTPSFQMDRLAVGPSDMFLDPPQDLLSERIMMLIPHPACNFGMPFETNLSYYIIPDKLLEITKAGTGCMCLSREIIQDRRLSFYPIGVRLEDFGIKENPHVRITPGEDFAFCFKARELGYRIWLDGSLTTSLVHFAPDRQGKAWSLKFEGGTWGFTGANYASPH